MIFISGFFLVNFIPFALMAIAGIVLFFWRGDKSAKYYYPLLLIIIALVLISIYRMPVSFVRRYAMPTLVPGIIISVFMLTILPDILKYYRVRYVNVIIRISIVILLFSCVFKAMREQEQKPHLQEIPEVLNAEKLKYKYPQVPLLVFGNPGGRLSIDASIKVIDIPNRHITDKFTDPEYQLEILNSVLNIETLKIQYPYFYLLVIEKNPETAARAWENKYDEKLDLIYEYIQSRNQIAYRLYKSVSEYESERIQQDKSASILASEKNLLKNGDLSKKYQLSPANKNIEVLRNRGIDLFRDEKIYLPEGWSINPSHGWAPNCSPVSIKFNAGTNSLNVQSKDIVSIYSDDTFDSNKTYLISISADSESQGYLRLFAYTYIASGKYLQTVSLKGIALSNQKIEYISLVKLKNCDNFKLALLFSGNVTIHNIKIVSRETNTTPNHIQ